MKRIRTEGWGIVVLLGRKFGRACLIISSLACLAIPTLAASKTWDANGLSPPSGVFNIAANWNVNGVPTNLDSALFSNAQNYTVVFDNSPTNNDLTVSAGAITFTGSTGARTYSLTDASGGRDVAITGGSLSLGTSGNPLHLTIGDDLRIRGGATLVSNFGSHISAADIVLGDSTAPTGNGTLIIDGAGSSLSVSATTQLGAGGQTGMLVVRNGATADFNGVLGLADASTSHFSNGVLNVESGGALTTANIRIGTNATNGQTGTFSVGSAGITSTVTQDANATLVVGATLGGPSPNSGKLNINSGGVFHSGTGTGTITVNPTGTISIAQGGVLNANGDVIIDGGVLEQLSTSTNVFNSSTGRTMTIGNGGRASFAENPNTATNATYVIKDAGSKLETTGALASLSINRGATVKVSSGGLVSSARALDIGTFGDGELSVDGSNSSAVATFSSVWGDNGATADATFSSNAIGTFAAVFMAHDNSAGTTANVFVLSGADLSVGSLFLAINGGLTTSAAVNVQGTGSTVTQTGASNLTVGQSATGAAAINIGTTASGAVFTTGTGLTTIGKTGTVNIGSGVNTGTLNGHGNITIDGGVLQRNNSGSTFNLTSGKTMTVQNGGRATLTDGYITADSAIYNVIGPNSKLEMIGGGLLATMRINNGGQVNVSAGGLVSSESLIDIATGAGPGSLSVDGTGSLAFTSTNIHACLWGTSGNTATATFSNNAVGTFNGSIEVSDSTVAGTTAIISILSGADLSVGNLTLATSGGSTTSATLNVNGNGSTVTQTGASTLTIGHASAGAAAVNIGTANPGGTFTTGSGLTTINKTGAVTVGSGANTGSLNANGNVTIDGGLLQIGAGSSVILAAAKSMTLVNGGTLKGSGNVTGSVINTSGIVEPGNSPGTLSITGNYMQAIVGQLVTELASTTTFDRLVATGSVSIAGTLDVDLLGGFVPQPGNVFQIISSSGVVTGTFGSASLPTLTGANWQLRYNPNSVVLQVALVGDYNFNGIVDASDYVVWRKSLGQVGVGLLADGNRNGQIDTGDYSVWRSHVGQIPGSGSGSGINANAAVPEPATLALLILAAAGVCSHRRHAA